MIYVDEIFDYQSNIAGHGGKWCHLFSDNTAALHDFAASIGLKREWFQDRPRFPHYDITPAKRALAIKKGAIPVTRKQAVLLLKGSESELKNE